MQTLAVILAIAVAAGYLARAARRGLVDPPRGGCTSSCSGCAESNASPERRGANRRDRTPQVPEQFSV